MSSLSIQLGFLFSLSSESYASWRKDSQWFVIIHIIDFNWFKTAFHSEWAIALSFTQIIFQHSQNFSSAISDTQLQTCRYHLHSQSLEPCLECLPGQAFLQVLNIRRIKWPPNYINGLYHCIGWENTFGWIWCCSTTQARWEPLCRKFNPVQWV